MFKGILSIIVAFFLLKYREKVVATTGKFAWCEKYLGEGSGTYRLMVILSILLFFWGVASITGTTDVFLSPLSKIFFPGGSPGDAAGSGGEWDF